MPALRTAAGAYLVPVGLPEPDEARAQLARHFGAVRLRQTPARWTPLSTTAGPCR
jgi:hypothetical protein